MQNRTISTIAQSIIWLCLCVIIFSPLYLSTHLFFPYIVTKTLAFNIAVEAMFLAFLLLVWKNRDYKIKINLAVILMVVYIAVIFIASLLGNDFYHSFWSNNERSEGIILFLHLFLFLTVLTGFFKKLKDWLMVFDVFFGASFVVAIVALGEYFKLSWVLASSDGSRLSGTIGNAGYMAGYLFFALFFGLFLLFKRKNIYLKIYYGLIIMLQIFIILHTDTRGGMIALFIAGLLLILYLLFFYFKPRLQEGDGLGKNKIINPFKILGWGVVLLVAVLLFLLVAFRDSNFIKNNRVLARIASISSESVTAKNRLMTWGSAWLGFKEKPLLGWGYENFYQPFDKYFNPQIYRHAGSTVWYDRAHNIVFDRLITGGLIGAVSYFLLLLLPFYFLWSQYRLKEGGNQKYLTPVLFSLVMLGYLIQNFFIFEALVTYVPLFLIVGFVGVFGRDYRWPFLENKNFKLFSLLAFVVLIIPIIYFVNIKPLWANMDLTKALSLPGLTIDQRMSFFESALTKNTNGNQEYRRQLFNFFQEVVDMSGVDQTALLKLSNFTGQELKKQLLENPYSVMNNLVAIRFNSRMFLGTGNPSFLEDNINLIETIKVLAPNRQQVYMEGSYTYLYLGRYYDQNKKLALAKQNYDLAVQSLEKAVALNDQNLEPYKQLASMFVMLNENNKLKSLISDLELKKSKDQYDRVEFLSQIMATAVSVKNNNALEFLGNILITVDPSNPQYYAQFAVAYANLGEDKKAIEIAQKISSLGANYKKQSDDLVARIKNGEFKK